MQLSNLLNIFWMDFFLLFAQISVPIDLSFLWTLIPNAVIIAVFYFAFVQKIKETVDEKLNKNIADQDDQIKKINKANADEMDKFEFRYEQRLLMMEGRQNNTEQSLNNTKEIVRILETHNMHIMKSVDEIKDAINRLHERLDKKD